MLRTISGLLVLLVVAFVLSLAGCVATSNNADPVGTNTVAVQQSPLPTAIPSPTITPSPVPPLVFDGDSAYDYLLRQMAFGPRWPGSPGHEAVGQYIIEQLENSGWHIEEQSFEYQDIQARNIIAKAQQGVGPVIIIGAHYDTRRRADHSPDPTLPVPGAVDGASGVAVLLELARTLDIEDLNHEVWLAFFDVEDNGNGGMPGFDWIAGSTYMARNLPVVPQAVVVVDMIGDADQQLYYEGNSDPALQTELWEIAEDLGFGAYFIKEYRHTMIDDHLPFARAGIPSVDIIDFDYPYYHTVDDTADKASPSSLERVGLTIERWIEDHLGK